MGWEVTMTNLLKLSVLLFIGLICGCSSVEDLQGHKSCVNCPEMVVVPAGEFMMGGYIDYGYGERDGPARNITISKPFLLSRYEVTIADFSRFVEESGHVSEGICNIYTDDTSWHLSPEVNWENPGFPQGEDHPVLCVSWNDVQSYIAWLNARTGKAFRLPSEAEWEYAAFLGGVGGNADLVTHQTANIGKTECCGGKSEGPDKWVYTAPVGSFKLDQLGLADQRGNVWEWQEDCYQADYVGAPSDGKARMNCDDLSKRAVRGGSYGDASDYQSRKYRLPGNKAEGYFTVGFRLAHD